MLKRLLSALLMVLPFYAAYAGTSAQGTAAISEDTKTRLSKPEIIDLMAAIGRLPAGEQDSKVDRILKDQAGSKTPRSDFLFCMGLAYLGNYKAQKCVGNAYENERGIVQDLLEAYTWFALALEQNAADSSAESERVKIRLISTYPAPSEDDLIDVVKAQKSRIAQYQEEAKKARK